MHRPTKHSPATAAAGARTARGTYRSSYSTIELVNSSALLSFMAGSYRKAFLRALLKIVLFRLLPALIL